MYRSDLERLCQPLKPEDALAHLRELQEALENSAWGTPKDLEAVTAGANVLEFALPGDPGMGREEHRMRGLGRRGPGEADGPGNV